MGVMISNFQSHEFGWGIEIINDQLKEINVQRYWNDYFDVIAATEVNGTLKKPPLMMSLFVHLFKFGGRML
jgi:hypothetical protein